ncbi:MAG: hypothetical protein EOO28_36515 [Comamonadaceae bacterium]|nr:MAG: hypothetical protein EOO28_36515 [Comamonadaceae bacterium]
MDIVTANRTVSAKTGPQERGSSGGKTGAVRRSSAAGGAAHGLPVLAGVDRPLPPRVVARTFGGATFAVHEALARWRQDDRTGRAMNELGWALTDTVRCSQRDAARDVNHRIALASLKEKLAGFFEQMRPDFTAMDSAALKELGTALGALGIEAPARAIDAVLAQRHAVEAEKMVAAVADRNAFGLALLDMQQAIAWIRVADPVTGELARHLVDAVARMASLAGEVHPPELIRALPTLRVFLAARDEGFYEPLTDTQLASLGASLVTLGCRPIPSLDEEVMKRS